MPDSASRAGELEAAEPGGRPINPACVISRGRPA
jgi:hypothetical protein